MTGFTSIRLHSLPASLMPGRLEAIADPIVLGKVDLVGRSSVERVMGHSGVVVSNVEIDQLLELPEAQSAVRGVW